MAGVSRVHRTDRSVYSFRLELIRVRCACTVDADAYRWERVSSPVWRVEQRRVDDSWWPRKPTLHGQNLGSPGASSRCPTPLVRPQSTESSFNRVVIELCSARRKGHRYSSKACLWYPRFLSGPSAVQCVLSSVSSFPSSCSDTVRRLSIF